MSSHTELSAALSQLVQLCQTKFQIPLSLPQLKDNPAYLDNVLAELAVVDDAPMQTLLAEIKHLRALSEEKVAAVVSQTEPADKRPALKVAAVGVGLAALFSAAIWYFSAVVSEPPALAAAEPDIARVPLMVDRFSRVRLMPGTPKNLLPTPRSGSLGWPAVVAIEGTPRSVTRSSWTYS